MSEDFVSRPAFRTRAGAFFSAVMTAALFALILGSVDGAAAFATDGMFGLGHLPAYVTAAVIGAPIAWVSWWVFRSALDLEYRAVEAPVQAGPSQ